MFQNKVTFYVNIINSLKALLNVFDLEILSLLPGFLLSLSRESWWTQKNVLFFCKMLIQQKEKGFVQMKFCCDRRLPGQKLNFKFLDGKLGFFRNSR